MKSNSMPARIRDLLDSLIVKLVGQQCTSEVAHGDQPFGDSFGIAQPAQTLDRVPTFANGVMQKATPMLQARFEYCGSIMIGQELWLSTTDMLQFVSERDVAQYHRALRDNWESSAPMLYPDDRLSLFGVTEDVPENLTYLVWVEDKEEPEVWSYVGFDCHRSSNLQEYLRWRLSRP